MGETHDIRRDAAATSDKKNLKAPDAINSDIDSMLPCPNSPNFTSVDDGFTEEFVRGMDGGCQ